MKRFFVLVLIGMVFILGCGKSGDHAKLQKGTPLYDVAKQMAQKLPYLDPDKNNVLVKTNQFQIRTAEVIAALKMNYGKRISQMANLDSVRLKDLIESNATRLAEKKLLLKAAKEANVAVSDEEVQEALATNYQQAGGEEKFAQMLAQNDIKLEDVKQQIREGMTIQKYLEQELAKQTEVTEDDIQAAYQEDKTATVRHILLKTQGLSDSAKQEVHKKMEKILARARKGEDFARLAKKYSEDPGSKNKGGLYENFGRGVMVKPFEDAAFSVPVGQISDIIETRFGYHILKVEDRKKETRPLKEVRSQIEANLKKKKQGEAYQAFMEKLKNDAGLEVVKY